MSVDGIGCSEVSGWPSGRQWEAYADSFRVICFSQCACGLHVACGWLTSILLALFVIASGWFSLILLAFFALCYSQWVAYVDFIGIICYSQWVICTDPLTLCILVSGCLAQFHLVSFSFISFLVLPVGGLGVASGGLRSFFCCSFSSRSRPLGWAASRTQGLCAFLLGLLRFRGE